MEGKIEKKISNSLIYLYHILPFIQPENIDKYVDKIYVTLAIVLAIISQTHLIYFYRCKNIVVTTT